MPLRRSALSLVVLVLACSIASAPLPAAPVALAAPAIPSGASTCGGALVTDADATVQQRSILPLGMADSLRVMRDSSASDTSEVLIHFPALDSVVPPGSAIHSAELVVYLSVSKPMLRLAMGSSGAARAWREDSVLWGTKPAAAGKPATKSYNAGLGMAGTPVRVDVTSLVRLWAGGEIGERTVILSPGSADMDVSFYSREGAKPNLQPQLVIRCSPVQAAVPLDSGPRDVMQMKGLNRLVMNSVITPTIVLDAGAVRFARLDLAIPPAAGKTGSERARWFLSTYGDALRLTDPATQMQLKRNTRNGQSIFFRQLHEGIPVHPAELGVHMDRNRIFAVGGGYVPDITTSPTPKLSAEQAKAIVHELAPGGRIALEPQLRFLNTGLTGGPDKETYLTWLVSVQNGNAYFVDATSGKVRLERPAVLEGFVLDLEDANNADYSLNCGDWDTTTVDDEVCDESGCTGDADAEAIAAYWNIRAVYDWWAGYPISRDGFDGDGSEIEVYIHVTDNGNPWNNAHYLPYGECFEFGEGLGFSRDTIGHEFMHGVSDYINDLDYEYESGAIKESFSDVFGSLTEGPATDWIMRTGVPSGTGRNLRDPSLTGNPVAYGDGNWYSGSDDHGGVHHNSTVPSHAAYLLIAGSPVHGDPMTGIGWQKGATFLYFAAGLVPSSATMSDLRSNIVGAVEFWRMSGLATQEDVCAVRNAYAAVGLGVGDADCDGAEDNVDPDADGDYVPNSDDNCPLVLNPGQADAEGDGQGDACDDDDDNDTNPDDLDNCPRVYNLFQDDWNHDGTGDACDDWDSDGIMDCLDNCPGVDNPDQADYDTDGIGDPCDPDRDGDGHLNTADNCPLEPNPYQEESDGDIWGDACDLCPGLNSNDNTDSDGDGQANPCDPDDDQDGVLDEDDNCQYIANPGQIDFDGDGQGMHCDEGEQRWIYNWRYAVEYKPAQGIIELGLPTECTMCGAMSELGQEYFNEALVTWGAQFYAQIVDSTGRVVASSHSDFRRVTQQVLRFQPASYAFTPNAGGAARLPAGAQATDPADLDYFLQIFPSTLVPPLTSHELSITYREIVLSKTFLPLVLR